MFFYFIFKKLYDTDKKEFLCLFLYFTMNCLEQRNGNRIFYFFILYVNKIRDTFINKISKQLPHNDLLRGALSDADFRKLNDFRLKTNSRKQFAKRILLKHLLCAINKQSPLFLKTVFCFSSLS